MSCGLNARYAGFVLVCLSYFLGMTIALLTIGRTGWCDRMDKISLRDDWEYSITRIALSDPIGWICMKICQRLYPDEFQKVEDK